MKVKRALDKSGKKMQAGKAKAAYVELAFSTFACFSHKFYCRRGMIALKLGCFGFSFSIVGLYFKLDVLARSLFDIRAFNVAGFFLNIHIFAGKSNFSFAN